MGTCKLNYNTFQKLKKLHPHKLTAVYAFILFLWGQFCAIKICYLEFYVVKVSYIISVLKNA